MPFKSAHELDLKYPVCSKFVTPSQSVTCQEYVAPLAPWYLVIYETFFILMVLFFLWSKI
jgi:hypothetical protein